MLPDRRSYQLQDSPGMISSFASDVERCFLEDTIPVAIIVACPFVSLFATQFSCHESVDADRQSTNSSAHGRTEVHLCAQSRTGRSERQQGQYQGNVAVVYPCDPGVTGRRAGTVPRAVQAPHHERRRPTDHEPKISREGQERRRLPR